MRYSHLVRNAERTTHNAERRTHNAELVFFEHLLAVLDDLVDRALEKEGPFG